MPSLQSALPVPAPPPGRSLIQTATPDELTQLQSARDATIARAEDGQDDRMLPELAKHIRSQFEMMRNHRASLPGWDERLLNAQRVFNRKYDPVKLQEIREFGGCEIYAGVTATKCRGATSLLREVYLTKEKPWGLDPTPEPTLPDSIQEMIRSLVTAELNALVEAGEQIDQNAIRDRMNSLTHAALLAAKKKAREEARRSEQKLEDFLVEGGFYTALAEFLVDLPIFPLACMKGPVVRVVPSVKWEKQPDGSNKAVQKNAPKMFWNRVSPFDIYFSPGVSDIEDADVIEVQRLTRADLNDLLGVPGYDEEAIRGALQAYKSGLKEYMVGTDSERAVGENRENPLMNQSGLIDCLEFHGNIQGQMLLDWGMDPDEIDDPDRDYFVQAWQVGRFTIKVQIHPSPRKRHPYYVTSFEKVPGTPVGNALPDILHDIQDVANASIRAMVNNMSIASGPQVVINEDRIAVGSDNMQLYPWKRWVVSSDPFNNNAAQKPVDFFQPQSNASELLGIYEKMTQIADELSAIPRYTTGSERTGGAGRTASGLAMLMGNANKILQTVASNIDRDVIQPLLRGLYDMALLTDEAGLFRGDESIRVRGVEVALQRETNRQRQLEMLQATNNPTDMQIMGIDGRAKLLRPVMNEVGLDGDTIIPTEEELMARMQAQQKAAVEAQQMMAEQNLRQEGEKKALTSQGNSGTPPKLANTDMGVQDAAAMRGMA